MKIVHLFVLAIGFGSVAAEENQARRVDELPGRLGNVWSAPQKRLVRATLYKKGKDGADHNTKLGKSSEKIQLHYGTSKEVGTVAVPEWVPKGSLVRLKTKQGNFLFIAADVGGSVERRSASKKLGKTKEQRAAPVLDFCAKKQVWPDFVTVEVYYYSSRIPFNELRTDEQAMLFAFAKKYFSGK